MLGGARQPRPLPRRRTTRASRCGSMTRSTDLWRIWWSSTARPGRLDPPVEGRFGGRRHGARSRPTTCSTACRSGCASTGRRSPATSARWDQAFSFDGGATWEPNWTMELSRRRDELLRPRRRSRRRRSAPPCSSSSGVPEPGISRTASLTTWARSSPVGQRLQHGVAEAALGRVVLDGDDRAAVARRGADGLGVDRLDRVGVEHARVHAVVRQPLGGLDRLVDA